jgi:hypothetical protein
MESKQISLPENIYNINNIFEKKIILQEDNPFKFYKKIYNLNLYLAKNINNLNYYYIDFPINKNINPSFVIKYLKNIDYRNAFSHGSLNFYLTSKNNENSWKEDEIYKGHKTNYNVIMTNFSIIFYNDVNIFNTNTSQAKYYMSYKIFSNPNNYILRFELVLNNMDLDQDIDINVYVNMIYNLLKTIHKKFKTNLDIVIEEPEVKQPQIEIPIIEKPWWNIFLWCSGSRKEKPIYIDAETQTNISLEDNKK